MSDESIVDGTEVMFSDSPFCFPDGEAKLPVALGSVVALQGSIQALHVV